MNHPDQPLLRDLGDLAQLQPDAAATARAVARARAAIESTPARPLSIRRGTRLARKLVAVAAGLLVAALVAQWLTPAATTRAFAFGEVQREVSETKTVQYLQTRRDRNKAGQTAPQESRKVMILGAQQIREEVKITTAGDPLPEGETWGRGPDEYITIYNAQTGKTITLFPGQKGYTAPQETLAIDPDSGAVKASKIEAAPQADFYQRIRDVPADKAKQLPDREIDGKQAAGFQVVEKLERPAGTDTMTRTYWVDRKTKLPLRVETSFRSTRPRMAETDWVKTNILFDAPLDQSLFSTDPPEGYKDLSADADGEGQP